MKRTYPHPADPALIEAVTKAAVNQRLTCAELRGLADQLGCSYAAIGQAAEEAGLKVKNCELGCF